ncbi:hypothetical protein MHYP_G00178470 [Metynnis hypsauchen]
MDNPLVVGGKAKSWLVFLSKNNPSSCSSSRSSDLHFFTACRNTSFLFLHQLNGSSSSLLSGSIKKRAKGFRFSSLFSQLFPKSSGCLRQETSIKRRLGRQSKYSPTNLPLKTL